MKCYDEVQVFGISYSLPEHDSRWSWKRSLTIPIKVITTLSVQKQKVHRFTYNLQGLQKVMVKDFSWNIVPWNALLFEKTLKQYKFSLARITDL